MQLTQLIPLTALSLPCSSTAILSTKIDHNVALTTTFTSSISSPMYRHTAYVDQKVRQSAYIILNHESWHQRNILSTAPNASLGASNITSDAVAIDEAFLLPDSSPINNDTDASSSNSAARLTNIPRLVQSTAAIIAEIETDAAWGNQTESACIKALNDLHGAASNAAGLAACYNVRSYDNTTTAFEADLRVYQIATPSGKWAHLQPASETLDIAYLNARIAKLSHLQKRKTMPIHLLFGQVEETKLFHAKRAGNMAPTRLQATSIHGSFGEDRAMQLRDETSIHSVFVPNITFSGHTVDSVPISTQLSAKEASFVHGLFTDLYAPNKGPTASKSANRTADFAYIDTTLAVFPIGFVITSIWAVLLGMIEGYSTLGKLQARNMYRRRVKARLGGGSDTTRRV